ncbi:MFS transporter [Sulfoacidibacillus thermotolerans]|uniref:MFS transporter n=1 Tax=Sulfoacidibacillus thermotolerans TaxID=1765684 RepID=UPI000D69B1B9|nr:MFS transporter [Sulfoacidibacillus thermotolerans]
MSMLLTVFIGFGLLIPVLPLMVKQIGASPLQLGLMLALYSVIALLTSPLWGHLSDRVGRKPVLVAGLLGFALSFLLFGLAEHMIWLMYVSRVIGGGFSGAVSATAMAYIADVTGVEERTRGMALAGAAIGMGFIIGPGVGGFLSHFGLRTPFFVAAALAVGNALWGGLALREAPRDGARGGEASLLQRRSWTLALAGSLKYLYFVEFVAQFAVSCLEGTFQYFEILKIGATASEIGGMFFLSGLGAAIVQGGFVQRYVKHGKELPVLFLGMSVSGLGLLLILLSSNFWTAALFMTVFSASNTLIRPLLTSLITKQTKAGFGLANGFLSSTDNLARIVGPIFATALYQIHPSFPYLVTAGITFLGLSLLVIYRRRAAAQATLQA